MTEEIDNGSRVTNPGREPPEGPVRAASASLRRVWPGPTPQVMAPDHLLRLFWRSRWIFLLCVVGALAGGFAYIAQCTPVFTSVSKLYVQQKTVAPPGIDTRSLPRYNLYTQAALLKSTPVLSLALQENSTWGQMRTFAGKDNPIAYLQKNIQVAVGKSDDVLTVSFDSPYPAEAAEIVNLVVAAYISDHEKHRERTSREVASTLRAKLDAEQTDCNDKLRALTDFQKANPTLALESEQGADNLQGYRQLETEHAEAQKQVREAETRRKRVVALADHPELLQPVTPPGAGAASGPAAERAQLEAKLFEKSLERSADEAIYTPGHEHLGNLDKEIAQIKSRLATIDQTTYAAALAEAEQQCLEARQNEEEIAMLLREESEKVAAHSTQLAEYARLRGAYEQSRARCQALEGDIHRMNVSDDFEPQEIRVLEVAKAQAKPSRPQRAQVLGIALVLGLLIGGAVSMVRDMLDQTIRSADEIRKLLGLSVLGVVPAMPRRQKASWRGQKTRLQPDSLEAEAFRNIRTAIVFGAAKESARTILVTSPAAGDGKSTVVSNLAIALAQAGLKTIVLDADFRKPTQHILFGADADQQGLVAALSGKATLAQAIQATEVQGLSLLSCGSGIPHPAEMLSSPAFVQVLRRLAQVYDRIILDAPPVMAVTDARVLGAYCDSTVLVLRADRSRRHICQRAIDALEATGTHLLGAVVNGVGRKGERFGYYGEYEHYYAAGRRGARTVPLRRSELAAARRPVTAAPLAKEGTST